MMNWKIGYILLLLAFGCGQPEPPPEPEVVLARVGETEITLSSFAQRLANLARENATIDTAQYLQAMIDEELLAQEAVRRGLDQRMEEDEQFQEQMRRLLLRELYRHEGIEVPQPTEEDLRTFFASSPYNRKVRFSLLMVRNEEQIPPLLKQLEEGADFEELSLQHSQDMRILDAGADMGYHTWGQTRPPHSALTEKAFTMRPGEIAGPLHVADGYFLIKLTDVHPIPFEQQREHIRALAIQQRLGEQLASYYAGLEERYELSYEEEGVKRLEALLVGQQVEQMDRIVVRYRGGSLNLTQVSSLLNRSGRMPQNREEQPQQHDQQICQWILMPLEIARLKLEEIPEVQTATRQISRRLLTARLREQVISKAPLLYPELVQEFYAMRPERYRIPARVEARRRLFLDQKEAEEVIAALRSGRDTLALVDDFIKLTYDEAAMKEETAVGQALRSPDGSIHGPLPTRFGYLVLQVLRQHPARQLELEAVRARVEADLKREQAGVLLKGLVQQLRSQHAAQIDIYWKEEPALAPG